MHIFRNLNASLALVAYFTKNISSSTVFLTLASLLCIKYKNTKTLHSLSLKLSGFDGDNPPERPRTPPKPNMPRLSRTLQDKYLSVTNWCCVLQIEAELRGSGLLQYTELRI